MENSKFNEIVDTLLEPRVKDKILKSRRQQHKPEEYSAPEDSIKLAPRGELGPCGDCDRLVRNRVVHYAVYDLARNPHWRKKCLECGQKTRISHPLKTP